MNRHFEDALYHLKRTVEHARMGVREKFGPDVVRVRTKFASVRGRFRGDGNEESASEAEVERTRRDRVRSELRVVRGEVRTTAGRARKRIGSFRRRPPAGE